MQQRISDYMFLVICTYVFCISQSQRLRSGEIFRKVLGHVARVYLERPCCDRYGRQLVIWYVIVCTSTRSVSHTHVLLHQPSVAIYLVIYSSGSNTAATHYSQRLVPCSIVVQCMLALTILRNFA